MSTQPLLTRADFKVLRPMQTRWLDNDHYGHVNNVAYYSYFDTAVNGYLMEATQTDTRAQPAIGIVAETSCKYLKEISFPDALQIGLRLEKLGNSSVIYCLAVFKGDDEQPAAVGRFVHVYVEARSRKPTPIPPAIRAALERLL